MCDGCFHKKAKVVVPPPSTSSSTTKAGPVVPGKKDVPRSQRGKEESDLARAIALSLAEANSTPSSTTGGRGFVQAPLYGSEPPLVGSRSTEGVDRTGREEEDDDADLLAAIEASLREMSTIPSAPPPLLSSSSSPSLSSSNLPVAPHPWELPPNEEDALLTFAQTVDLAARAGGELGRFQGVDELGAVARGVVEGRVRGGLEDVGGRQRTFRACLLLPFLLPPSGRRR